MTTAPLTPHCYKLPRPPSFDGFEFTGLLYKGQALVLAREMGEALGYSNRGKPFVDAISRSWADELNEGRDFIFVTPADEEARDLLVVGGVDSTPLNNRGSMCLTARGAKLAPFLGRTDKSKEFRAYLVDELLPWCEEAERLLKEGPAASTPRRRPVPLAEARELRLRQAAELRAMKALVSLGEAEEGELAKLHRRHLQEMGALRDEVLVPADTPALQVSEPSVVHQTIIQRGKVLALLGSVKPLPDGDREPPVPLQQIADTWLSPMQIAEAIGMVGTFHERKARVGHAISGAGFREHPKLAHPISVPKLVNGAFLADEEGRVKMTQGWAYRPDVVEPIRAWMRERKPEWLGLDPDEVEAARCAQARLSH